jgi:uncharacterized phosphosugar-binding protein
MTTPTGPPTTPSTSLSTSPPGLPGPPGLPSAGDRFLDAAIGLLRRVRDEEAAGITAAGALVADVVADGGRLFAFGAGHSSLPAQDLVYRAGGLAPMNLLAAPGLTGVDTVPATLGSALEHVGGLAAAILGTAPARTGDLLVIVSLSGRNALPVELARTARTMGITVIGVTSLTYARSYAYPPGTALRDHCDLVLDSKIGVGDAELTAEGVPAPFGPASGVVAAALLQAVMATAVAELAARGVEPPLLRSGNVEGGRAWNDRVMDENRERIFYRHRS